MARSSAGLILGIALGLLLSPRTAPAQKYTEDAPIPPGAKGEVRELKATVLELKATVLEIRGLAAGLTARVDPLAAALKELGARVQDKQIKIDLAADVLFDFDKFDLRPSARPALEQVAKVLKAHPRATATIEGHTDGKGSDQYNQRLSQQRAESVRRWLVANGVTTRMIARGLGKARPVAPNIMPNGADNPDGRQKNRRVEITVRTQ
jgi:outer membrane protein OmpA-like peptidoglycan-associated protein